MTSTMTDFLAKDIFKIIHHLANSRGLRVFVVGVYVRDCYLGRKSDDIEIVVEGDAIEFGRLVGDNIQAQVSYFKNFGVSTFKYQGDKFTFTGAQKGIFKRDERKQILVPGTIKDDLRLRDFTINALAISLSSPDFGSLIDIFDGLNDINQGVIRTPVQPDNVFRDNPRIMLRAIRLVAELSTPSNRFHIAPGCLDAIWKYADKIDLIAKERVSEELNKILMCEMPSTGIKLLDELRILPKIIPALSRTKGVETKNGFNHEDSFPHSLAVLDNIAKLETQQSSVSTNSLGIKQGDPNLWLRWAALLHEIGKPSSKRFASGKGWTFHGYDVVGAKMVAKVFSSLKMPLNEKMKYVQKLISLQNRPKTLLEIGTSESAYRRLLFDAGEDIWDLMLLCKANITTVNKAKANKEHGDIERVRQQLLEVQAKESVRNFKNPISANYIMELYGLEPCDTLGILKDIIKKAILDGKIENNFEAAEALLRKKAAEMGLKVKGGASDEKKAEVIQQESADTISKEALLMDNPAINESVILINEEIGPIQNIAAQGKEPVKLTPQSGAFLTDAPILQSSTSITDCKEIIKTFNDSGISKLFFITSEEEFNAIKDGDSLIKDYFTLFTHDFSKEVRKESLIALEIDLRVLSLPRTILSFEELLSKGITFGTELSSIKDLKQYEGLQFNFPTRTQRHDLLSSCVIIVRDSIPVDYIINFEAINDEYSSSLPF